MVKGNAQFGKDEKHREVALRIIGHQVLLRSGDSISRVLPIEKEGGRYRIQFEAEFGFYPEELVGTINQVIKETGISAHFIVEVEQCETGEIVYSYEMDFLEQTNVIHCKSRVQPKSCYRLLFTLMDPDGSMASVHGVAQDSLDGPVSNTGQEVYVISALLLFLVLGAFVFLLRKRRRAVADSHLISLGEYQFDKRNTELVFGNKRTELTGKEADLLLVLYKAANTSVEREVILNKVWGDKGDYVGRTLDVFISKLRKKFEADPKVKIVNVRGVGYKLVIGV